MSHFHEWWDRVSGKELERAQDDWKSATIRTNAAQLKLCSRTARMHDVDAAKRALDALEAAMKGKEEVQ